MGSTIAARVDKFSVSTIWEDRAFIKKISAMLLLIIALSLSIIYYESLSKVVKNSATYYYKLTQLERTFSGEKVDTTVKVDDFNGLDDLDLSDIEILTSDDLVETKTTNTNKSITANINIKNGKSSDKTTIKEEKNRKIMITSSEKSSTKKVHKKRAKKIFITSQNMKSLSFMKKRFYATNNISFALTIANRFLEKKNYKKALKWSMIANEIDDKDERSWIIFAKAKIGLHEKEDAVNALQAYLKNHQSTNVKKFLDDISKS